MKNDFEFKIHLIYEKFYLEALEFEKLTKFELQKW